MNNNSTCFKSIVVSGLISVIALLGCGPRGETKSLDEIYEISKSRYEEVKTDNNNDIADLEALNALESALKDLSMFDNSSKNLTAPLAQIAKSLDTLEPRMGYTARVTAAEVRKQATLMASESEQGKLIAVNQVKLLSSRVYNLLTAELESTGFQLS